MNPTRERVIGVGGAGRERLALMSYVEPSEYSAGNPSITHRLVPLATMFGKFMPGICVPILQVVSTSSQPRYTGRQATLDESSRIAATDAATFRDRSG